LFTQLMHQERNKPMHRGLTSGDGNRVYPVETGVKESLLAEYAV